MSVAPLLPVVIGGYDNGGLIKDKKPFMLANQAFSRLENAYVWRDRVKKREGLELLGRLKRTLTTVSLGNSGASPWSFNIYATLAAPITGEADAEVVPSSVTIVIGGAITFTDNGVGVFTSVTPGNSGTINYATGDVVLTHTGGVAATTITFSYYPCLPVMGIWQREISGVNSEQTFFFDTKYSYIESSGFQQYSTSTWDGADHEFFWTTNYRGTNPFNRLFFVTNFNDSATVPMRYTDGLGTWTTFNPILNSGGSRLLQARILIPYYGRLLALNTIEGTTAGSGSNYFMRCRFSQVGDPTVIGSTGPYVSGSWAEDVFGKGGFIDAPTNEEIVSATFMKNTLIVQFEKSIWELRYVGEYGLPFIWERISSDFGCDSTFSTVLFDEGALSVGDRAITTCNSVTAQRIDEQIPDEVFDFSNLNNGPERVIGIRDYVKEMVYWCYSDGDLERKFPNYTLLYNYRNNTFANIRNNVTFFGIYQPPTGITWDSTTVTWDDESVFWDDDPSDNALVPLVVCGNQKGYIHKYATSSVDDPSLNIKDVTIPVSSADPVSLEVPNHNLESGEIIKVTGLMFVSGAATDLNSKYYQVVRVDADNIEINQWNDSSQSFIENYSRTPASGTVYIGGGQITLYPRMKIQTKDFNPFMSQGNQMKLSYVDFLFDSPDVGEEDNTQVTVKLYVNSSLAEQSNVLVSQQEVETDLPSPYYVQGAEYSWHRFVAVTTGQFVRVELTYDDVLMTSDESHNYEFTLNSMIMWVRVGSKTVI